MPDIPPSGSDRLDSWKAIAAYLHRDERTVRRWERHLGLPVRRVSGGRGASVFAFASELDTWLLAQGSPAIPPPRARGIHPSAWLAVALLVVAAGAAATWVIDSGAGELPARIDATAAGIVARDASGAERWRYAFPPAERVRLADTERLNPVETLSGEPASIVVATSYRIHTPDETVRGGELLSLSAEGGLQRAFSFDDTPRFTQGSYGAPWAIIDYRVTAPDRARHVAIAAHHYTWWPGLVTVLDDQWNRGGTFVNAGWVERVHWLSADRLLIAGFSESRDGGMVALLDAGSIGGQSPEDTDGPFYCLTCGDGRPVKYVVLPRSELNRVTASRFNRARVQVNGDRILARAIEVPAADVEAVDALYEFTHALDLVSAAFSDRYWEIHRSLEAQGRLDHTREQCPDRDGPRAILVWEPTTGWRTIATRAG